MDLLGDILSGFGISTPSAAGTIVGGTVSGAGSAAQVSGGNPWVTLGGAVAGAVGSFFDYKAAEKAAKAATELAQTQLEIVNIAAKKAPSNAGSPTSGYYYPLTSGMTPSYSTMPVGTTVPMVPTATGAYAPSMGFVGGVSGAPQIPAVAGTPTTVPTTTSTIGRAFPTPGDTMAGFIDPFLQALSAGLTNGGAVTQPAGVATGTGGLPLPGQSAVGAISPAAPVTVSTVARPVSTLTYVNPVTGQPMTYKYMGKPVLYSGDLAACRRVNRIARRVSKAMPRRRRSP